MAIETSTPRSRRALLAGGFGGLAAILAAAVGRPAPILAGDGEPVLVGGWYTASSVTKIRNADNADGAFKGETVLGAGVIGHASGVGAGVRGTSHAGIAVEGISAASDAPALFGVSTAHGTGVLGLTGGPAPTPPASAAKTGVYGYADQDAGSVGVRGASVAGVGVLGTSQSGDGVVGSSQGPAKSGVYGSSTVDGGFGVFGRNKSTAATGALGAFTSGVVGSSPGACGVIGTSGSSTAPTPSETGVYGFAGQSANAFGVYGRTTIGRGVFGRATSGNAMYGYATSGIGLHGVATTGLALCTDGRVRIGRASGIATIAATRSSVVVTPGLDVKSGAFVLLTPQASVGGRSIWSTTNPSANTFTIRVSTAVPADLRIGWLLLG